MWLKDTLVLVGIGSLSVFLGIITVIWGRREEKRYYDSISTHTDVREYLEHWPKRPQPGSLMVGGWIAIAIGMVIWTLAAIFYFVPGIAS